jgi:hypothetical protein
MGVPQEKSGSNAAQAASGQPAFSKILYRARILYRAACLVALLAGVGSAAVVADAQEERPQITPGERRVPRKKDAEPRAVALLQLTSNGKASLVPIAILINGKFWDATAYKAAPVPMALESGTVYEAERSGSSLGLFTVSSALHSNAVNVQSPWIGTGAWRPAGAETEKKPLTAEPAPVGIDTSEGPPRLTKNPTPPATPEPAPAPPASTPSSPPASGPSSGDEPPRLTKPAASPAPAPPSTPGSPPQNDSKGAPGLTAPQAENKPADAKPADRPKGPASDSGADEASRPRLRRGKPAEPLPEDEIPGYSKPGAAPSANTGKPSPAADTGPIQLIPAISDSAGPDPHSFGFEWLKDEEGERRKQITVLAKEQLRADLDARAKARITPKPTGPQAARRVAAKKPPEPVLSNIQMTAYDLWASNQPIIVFSAQAQIPPSPAGQGGSDDLQYSILLVAYPDTYNNLHKLYVGVTDKYHLDLTPRLELIDAVDADGDGRGELLFRETSDAGSGWVIYRATADKLWKMFDSLNPE